LNERECQAIKTVADHESMTEGTWAKATIAKWAMYESLATAAREKIEHGDEPTAAEAMAYMLVRLARGDRFDPGRLAQLIEDQWYDEDSKEPAF
jgi:hypothetical protein